MATLVSWISPLLPKTRASHLWQYITPWPCLINWLIPLSDKRRCNCNRMLLPRVIMTIIITSNRSIVPLLLLFVFTRHSSSWPNHHQYTHTRSTRPLQEITSLALVHGQRTHQPPASTGQSNKGVRYFNWIIDWRGRSRTRRIGKERVHVLDKWYLCS